MPLPCHAAQSGGMTGIEDAAVFLMSLQVPWQVSMQCSLGAVKGGWLSSAARVASVASARTL